MKEKLALTLDTHVRQAAVYGAGAVAQFGGPNVAPLGPELTQRLVATITGPDAREPRFAVVA